MPISPDSIAPGVAFNRFGKAVGGVGGREAFLHLRIGAAARDIEKRAAARRVAGAQPGTGLILTAAGQHIAVAIGREAGHAVLGFAAAAFDQRADDEIAHAAVHADPSEIFGAVAVVGAAAIGGAGGAAATESRRKDVGAIRVANGVAIIAVAIVIEQQGFSARSEERRVGNEGVRTCKFPW